MIYLTYRFWHYISECIILVFINRRVFIHNFIKLSVYILHKGYSIKMVSGYHFQFKNCGDKLIFKKSVVQIFKAASHIQESLFTRPNQSSSDVQ